MQLDLLGGQARTCAICGVLSTSVHPGLLLLRERRFCAWYDWARYREHYLDLQPGIYAVPDVDVAKSRLWLETLDTEQVEAVVVRLPALAPLVPDPDPEPEVGESICTNCTEMHVYRPKAAARARAWLRAAGRKPSELELELRDEATVLATTHTVVGVAMALAVTEMEAIVLLEAAGVPVPWDGRFALRRHAGT